MPSVTCPGCEKKYNLPATAAGQVANCKCGKKFRVGGSPAEAKSKPAAATASAAKANPKPAAPQPAVRAVAPAASVAAATKPAAPRPAVAAKSDRLEASMPKPKPKQDDGFWDDVDKPLADLELEPVEATPRPSSAFRAPTRSPVQAPQQNIIMRMWHSRARKLLMGPPIVILGIVVLVSKFNSGERIPRGGFFLVAIGLGITWAGLTGETSD